VALATALGLAWLVLFTPASILGAGNYPVEVVAIPPMLWAAYRFGPRTAAVAVFALTIVALAGTQAGMGPFAGGSDAATRYALQAFIAVTSVTTMILATVTNERREAEAQLVSLARTDGLTGLANYRTIIESLQREVARGMRRGNGFAVIFLDLDDLKGINDTRGHIAGNRAIIRLANAIAVNCRAIDVPARIGGDEFCVVLPGADEPTAWQVVDRIQRALEAPGVSGVAGTISVRASAGVAMYPRDGATAEDLLGAADVQLYGAKSRRAVAPRAPGLMRAGAPA
jgi:diguanylate cyclase (GGDEF)-like protein